MDNIFLGAAVILILTFILGFVRIFFGPARRDYILAAQLLGTSGVAVLLLLGKFFRKDSLLDVALLYAFLAAVSAIAFFVTNQPSFLKKEEK